MATPPPPPRRPSPVVRPWHKAVAWVVLAGSVVAPGGAVPTRDASTAAEWCKRIGPAVFILAVFGGLSGAIAAPRAIARISAWFGWALPAVLLWLGVELWLDGAEFRGTGRRDVRSEAGGRFAGAVVIAIGLALLVGYVVAIRAVRRRRAAPKVVAETSP